MGFPMLVTMKALRKFEDTYFRTVMIAFVRTQVTLGYGERFSVMSLMREWLR
jgi:hypothetical protein